MSLIRASRHKNADINIQQFPMKIRNTFQNHKIFKTFISRLFITSYQHQGSNRCDKNQSEHLKPDMAASKSFRQTLKHPLRPHPEDFATDFKQREQQTKTFSQVSTGFRDRL